MINTENIKLLSKSVSELLGTPVSEKLLALLSPKQRFAVYTNLSIGDGELAKKILDQERVKLSPHKCFKYQPVKSIF
jgi:hypothetical protein